MTFPRSFLATCAHFIALGAATLALAAPLHAQAQARKDSVVLAMVLEPAPGLDPTVAAAAAIGEVVHLSVLEGLTKINMDGKITPLLAESWSIDPDGMVYTFKLKKGVKFHDGAAFDASDVKFSFERAKAPGSTNKAKKAVFDNISRIDTPDPATVIVVLNNADGNFLFRMGENTAVILDPKSAPTTATKPIGTGPFKFESWAKGSSITLVKNEQFRDAAKVAMKKVTFRFINDSAAQVAALLAGDIDGMPRFGALESLKQFQSDQRFSVVVGGTEGKTIMTINNKKKPFDDVRVRRAIAMAVDRKAVIDGAQEGFGKPIGSHMVPSDAGFLQQCLRLFRVVRIHACEVDVAGIARHHVAADRRAVAFLGAVDHRLAVDRRGDGAAHAHVVEGLLPVIDGEDGLAFGAALHHREAGIALELLQVRQRAEARHAVDIAGQ